MLLGAGADSLTRTLSKKTAAGRGKSCWRTGGQAGAGAGLERLAEQAASSAAAEVCGGVEGHEELGAGKARAAGRAQVRAIAGAQEERMALCVEAVRPRQGGPGVCAGEGAGSTSEAPEALLATGEASSSEEEQGCSRAQLRTRAASLSRLAVGEGSAGLTGEGAAGGAGEGGMLMGVLAEEASVSRSWRVVQRARAGLA